MRSIRASEPVSVVFVYGTLRAGRSAHSLVAGSVFLGRGTVSGFRLYDCGAYPAAIRAPRGSAPSVVSGECYGVSPETLRRLDRYEGTPSLYGRETVDVRTEDGRTLPAFLYVFRGSVRGLRPCPSGTWEPVPGFRYP